MATVAVCLAIMSAVLFAWTSGKRILAADAAGIKKTVKPPKKLAGPPPIPLEQRPYRIRVSVAFSGSTDLLPQFRRQIMRSLKSETDRGYGTMFRAEFVTDNWVTPPSRLGLLRIEPRQMLERFPEAFDVEIRDKGFDKVFLLTIEVVGPQYRIAGREWDTRSRRLGPILTARTSQRCEVGVKAFSLLPRLFRPVLQVVSVQPKSVELRLQAGYFVPLDPALVQLRKDDVVIPYFRYANKKKIVRRIQFLSWTYALVDSLNGAWSIGEIISPYFTNPLGSGRRRRVQIMAIRVRPHRTSSRVKMVYQTDETKPLIGYNVQLVSKRRYRDIAAKPAEKQFSGRDGFIHVPVDPERPIVWIYVYSGSALLARVPYVPGIETGKTLPLPDDSIRLTVEGEVDLLKGKLIDVVARRATLMALAKMADENPKLNKAQKRKAISDKFKEISSLPDAENFHSVLGTIREPGLQSARQLKNKFAERRIRKLCDNTAKLIDRYLDMAPVRKFRGDLEYGTP